MKMPIYISDPDKFLNGDFESVTTLSLTNCPVKYLPDHWIFAGEVDLDIDIDRQTVVNSVLATIERTEKQERAEHQVKMDLLESRKQEFISLEHKS